MNAIHPSAKRLSAAVAAACALFAYSAARASDDLNLCINHDPGPGVVLDLPEDNSIHLDQTLGYPEYEQWYWNGLLSGPGGKKYAYFVIFYQFTAGDFPYQYPVRGAGAAVQDLQTKTMYKDIYFDFMSGAPFPSVEEGKFDLSLANPNSSFKISAVGKNGIDKLNVTLGDGTTLNLVADNVKNPQPNFHGGFMRYCDLGHPDYQEGDCDQTTPSADEMFGHGLNIGEPWYHGEHYYFSRPRMAAAGSVKIQNGSKKVVAGDAWFDREFGTMVRDLQWVWYSIRLDTGEEINMYDMRNYPQPTISEATWMTGDPIVQSATFQGAPLSCEREELFGNAADGGTGDFEATYSGGAYGESRTFQWPTDFTFNIPSKDLYLNITPSFMEQEFFVVGVFTPYWIGIADVEGTRNGQPVKGHAYIEVATKCCNGDDGDDLPPVHP